MGKIKVLFYLDSFMIGGMHRQMLYLVNNIDKSNFEPIVCVTGFHGGLKESFIATGCKLHDLKWKGGFDIKIPIRLRSFLKQENPKIIFICEPQNLIYYRLSRIFYNKRIIQIGSFRAMTFWLGHMSWRHKIIDDILSKLLYKTSEKVVVNSEVLKKHYSSIVNMSNKKNIEVIYNGSDFDFESKIDPYNFRKEIGFSEEEVLIIMIARLDPWKDFYTLFESVKILIEDGQKFKILLIGGGKLQEDLKRRIIKFNLEKIVFLMGEKLNVVDYINVADIIVHSTFGEGFSNSIMEAMAMAKPVIATDVGGNPELIGTSGQAGLLIPEKSPDLFAKAISELINKPDLRAEMGEKAKERIHNLCNINEYVKTYESFFSSSLKKKGH
ncbi:MAG: glycosyltransferase involved in cell wall biosynthesis [Flavobacteriaceae bacterium]|jgi:glycosyltransferase involved in cell wall biosynthesis